MKQYLPNKEFLKTFFKYTTPVIIQALVSFLIGLVDTLLVSGLTNEAVSATYAVSQITFILNTFVSGIIMGASVYVQQFFGAKDEERLLQAHRMKLILGGAIFLLLTITAFIFGPYFIKFYARSSPNKSLIMAEAAKYAPIIYVSYIPYGLTLIYTSTFREIRKTSYPMIASVTALVMNVILGYLLIYVADFGIKGAAIATLISRILEFSILLLLAYKHHLISLKNTFKDFVVSRLLGKEIMRRGFPLFLNHLSWGLGMVALSSSYAAKADVLSALHIFNTTTAFFSIIYNALAVGVSIMIGNVLGEGKPEEAKRNAWQMLIFGIMSGVVFGVILISLSPFIPLSFKEVSVQEKELASKLLIIYGSCLSFFTIPTVSFGALRAGGKPQPVLILDVISMWIWSVPIAWLLITYTMVDLVWIYLAVQFGDFFKAVIGIIVMKKVNWANNLTTEFKEEINHLPSDW